MATIFSILTAIGFSSMGIIPSENLNNTNNLQVMFNAAEMNIKQLHTQKVANQIFGFLAAVSISLLTPLIWAQNQIIQGMPGENSILQ
jgi:hypothetical protein